MSQFSALNYRLCTAPMMDWSDQHCRFLWRLLSPNALMFSEMITAKAILNGDRDKLLRYSVEEQPLILQLGGADPDELARACLIAAERGFAGIDLNCGCPSDRVQGGNIGAILMKDPNKVAACYAAMSESCSLPITVKHRVGVDDQDEERDLNRFIEVVADAGCTRFIVHARKAWLHGLSPKENRSVPPLNYERVYALKTAYPKLAFIINGGIETVDACRDHLKHTDGVMIGRKIYSDPYYLQELDHALFNCATPRLTRMEVAKKFERYIAQTMEIRADVKLHHMTRHALGLWHGQTGGKRYRRYLSEHACKPNANWRVFAKALDILTDTENSSIR